MSLVRLVPAGIHALGDYAAGIVLLLAGIICDGPGAAKATGIVLGLVLIVVSLFTRYPLGAIRVIPFRVHSAGDYLGGILSIVAPFALGFWDDNKGVSTLYIVVGAVIILLSLVTDYNWGPDRDYGAAASARSHGRAAGAH